MTPESDESTGADEPDARIEDGPGVPQPLPHRPTAAPVAPKTARIAVSLLLIAVLLGLGVAGFRFFASMKKPPGRAATPPPRVAIRVRPAERTSHQEIIHGYGRARALRATTVAAELSATILEIAPELEAGVAVEKDAVLLRLDDRDARTALDGARARLASSRADVQRLERESTSLTRQLDVARDELASAERELARERQMLADGTSSASDVDSRSLQATARRSRVVNLEGSLLTTASQSTASEAAVQAASADEQRAQNDLTRCAVKAPFSGVIEARLVGRGGRVAPGTPLFELIDPSEIEIPIALPASHYGDVHSGARVELRLTEGAAPVAITTVARVAPNVDTASRTFSAYVLLRAEANASRPAIPPGAFVVASVVGRRYDDVYVIPRAAFVAGALFLADPDGASEALVRSVTPAIRATLVDVILVQSGLEPGERIVISNVEQIADGSRVRLILEQDEPQ